MKRIVISGYHGFANSGDEALLRAIVESIRKKCPDADITVLSKIPDVTASDYGVKSVYRYNFLKLAGIFRKSDLLIFGGGSLLQDATSSKSLLYYLCVIRLALLMGTKAMLYANGIGPLKRRYSRILTRRVLNKVDIITLRDDNSDIELQNIGVTRPQIVITADPAFTLHFDDVRSGKEILQSAGVAEGEKFAVVSVRDWKDAESGFEKKVAALCDRMYEKYGVKPVFLPMQYPCDAEISKRIISISKCPCGIIDKELEVADIFSVIAHSDFTVGMRLHTLIYATALGVPAIALSYDPKITAFVKSINQPLCADVGSLGSDELTDLLDELMRSIDERRCDIQKALVELRGKAEENADFAIRLLNE